MEQNNYNGTLQKPVGSGFNAVSTTSDVIKEVDLNGKIAIVTGGDGGLGLEITKTLSKAGAAVIVPARDIEKAKLNLQGIANVEVEPMNLTEPVSITSFAEKFLASDRQLHMLINNAGIMWTPLQRDSRGYEAQFSTNHLGHFQLTAKLWEALKKAEGARVVTVSSSRHTIILLYYLMMLIIIRENTTNLRRTANLKQLTCYLLLNLIKKPVRSVSVLIHCIPV
ncbi:SDR family NAD(P)-dependent oxidoreductase [Mucilaginibacter sp. P25]|uniref:SDR family NAD(P)-dependent oxidoreductase n=1 Tax=Mucilaginibacter sp. P25 TaxID=3423945 RepID=UPI003D7996EF